MRKFLLLSYLFLMMVACSGNFSIFNILLLSLLAGVIVLLGVKLELFKYSRTKSYFHLTSIYYIIWIIVQIVQSSIALSKTIWGIRLEISPHVAWLRANIASEESQVIFANSITLTPGTYTIEVGEKSYLIHALWSKEIEVLRQNNMKNKVEQL
jgi:multicomponent Na+:H+ antiporter subunit E